MEKKSVLMLALIIFLGVGLRFYGINWDQGFHLHPDERMLIMVAERVRFFDQLNPHFFNYGSLPIYLLKATADLLNQADYQQMLYVGRTLSVTFDLITIFFIYQLSYFLFKKKIIAIFSSFFYSIAFFPIQNSHFFISDVFLNSLTTGFFYFLLRSLNSPSRKNLMIFTALGLIFAAMITTKISALVFLPIVYLFIVYKSSQKKEPEGILKNIIINLLIFHLSFLIFSFIFMPYGFLDYKNFLNDISLQMKMNNNPYIFPYTLQYVNTRSYLYYLKNIFFWGLGPAISILSAIGLSITIKNFFQDYFFKEKINSWQFKDRVKNCLLKTANQPLLIILLFYFYYFLILGRSAVKFMRYLLPVYPLLTIFASYGLFALLSLSKTKRKISLLKKISLPTHLKSFCLIINPFKIIGLILFILAILWTISFINIYSQKHTRLTASEWILKNIPPNSILAVEHWDDRLPLENPQRYYFLELTLYDQPDDKLKWQILNEKLTRADYIIIASNRLYIPLQKLNDCKKYQVCYPKTAEYYKKLFNEELGFKKVAEFAVYPGIKIGPLTIKINDQNADESFTVYDHPKIMIFKKINITLSPMKN